MKRKVRCHYYWGNIDSGISGKVGFVCLEITRLRYIANDLLALARNVIDWDTHRHTFVWTITCRREGLQLKIERKREREKSEEMFDFEPRVRKYSRAHQEAPVPLADASRLQWHNTKLIHCVTIRFPTTLYWFFTLHITFFRLIFLPPLAHAFVSAMCMRGMCVYEFNIHDTWSSFLKSTVIERIRTLIDVASAYLH